MGALCMPQKVKGCQSDVTLEKTTQEYWKYNSHNMYVSKTKLTKENVMLLDLVRSQ